MATFLKFSNPHYLLHYRLSVLCGAFLRQSSRELPGKTFWSSLCRHQGWFTFPPVTSCECLCVKQRCLPMSADLIMTSSIRHAGKNICHRLYADCSPAFRGNDLHLSTSTDHLSWFGFSSKSPSSEHQERHRGFVGSRAVIKLAAL